MSSHIETSQLICRANQLADFYVRGTLIVKGLMNFSKFEGVYNQSYQCKEDSIYLPIISLFTQFTSLPIKQYYEGIP